MKPRNSIFNEFLMKLVYLESKIRLFTRLRQAAGGELYEKIPGSFRDGPLDRRGGGVGHFFSRKIIYSAQGAAGNFFLPPYKIVNSMFNIINLKVLGCTKECDCMVILT